MLRGASTYVASAPASYIASPSNVTLTSEILACICQVCAAGMYSYGSPSQPLTNSTLFQPEDIESKATCKAINTRFMHKQHFDAAIAFSDGVYMHVLHPNQHAV